MEKIEKALNTFNLNYNFTDEALEKAHALRKNITYVDFKNKVEDKSKENEIEYDYLILKIHEYLRDKYKDIDLNERVIFNMPDSAKVFYKKEENHIFVSQLFDFLKKDVDILMGDIERAKTTEDLEKSFNDFKKGEQESCIIFVNSILEKEYDKVNMALIQETIFTKANTITEIIIETCNFAINKNALVTERFKTKLEESYEHNTNEYRKGIEYYMMMRKARTNEEAENIYNIAAEELFNSKPNLR